MPGSTRHPSPVSGVARDRRAGDGPRLEAGMTRPCLVRLARVLHVLDDVELDVVELAVLLLDLAQVDVLHHVAGLRVDVDRAARALEDLALHAGQQRLAAALA